MLVRSEGGCIALGRSRSRARVESRGGRPSQPSVTGLFGYTGPGLTRVAQHGLPPTPCTRRRRDNTACLTREAVSFLSALVTVSKCYVFVRVREPHLCLHSVVTGGVVVVFWHHLYRTIPYKHKHKHKAIHLPRVVALHGDLRRIWLGYTTND